jgi:hypothetical protein
MKTENIVKFLQTAYSDEKLAALLAHAQDGKLAFCSCCCFIGVADSIHALQGHGLRADVFENHPQRKAFRSTIVGKAAEFEFHGIGQNDAERRERLIPLILAEMERRELLRKLPDLPLSEQLRLEEEAAAEEGAAIEASGYMDPVYERNGR